jgi:hypothetical protein
VTIDGPDSQRTVLTPGDAPTLHATAAGKIGPWSFFFDDPQMDVGDWTFAASDGTCETDVSLKVQA